MDKEDILKDKIRGSLIAGAAGDALGYAVEFTRGPELLKKYGPEGITRFKVDKNGKALISDDTQMTLFTANGILMGVTRGAMRGIGGIPENYVDGAYLDWYFTQTGKKSEFSHNDFHYTWLRDLPELAHRRAPGLTCLSACESILKHQPVKNDSKGCGGIMRVAPIALFAAAMALRWPYSPYEKDINLLAQAAAKIAKVTHLHPLGYLPASLLAVFIYRIIPLSVDEIKRDFDEIIKECLEAMIHIDDNDHQKHKKYLIKLTLEAIRLAKSDIPDSKAIKMLGEGWVAEETWAIALFCTLRHIDSVKDAIIASVNHDGDSDSTGSVTGNIVGAIHGYKSIVNERLFCPDGKKLEDTLELHNIILALADDLFSGCIISEYDFDSTPEKQQWFERYCQMIPSGI